MAGHIIDKDNTLKALDKINSLLSQSLQIIKKVNEDEIKKMKEIKKDILEIIPKLQNSQDDVEKLIDNKINVSFEEYKTVNEVPNEIGKDIVKKFIPFDGTTNL